MINLAPVKNLPSPHALATHERCLCVLHRKMAWTSHPDTSHYQHTPQETIDYLKSRYGITISLASFYSIEGRHGASLGPHEAHRFPGYGVCGLDQRFVAYVEVARGDSLSGMSEKAADGVIGIA